MGIDGHFTYVSPAFLERKEKKEKLFENTKSSYLVSTLYPVCGYGWKCIQNGTNWEVYFFALTLIIT